MDKTFDFLPVLHGDNISIRPLTRNDFDALFSAASDSRIWQGHPSPDRYQAPVFKGYFEGALKAQALVVIDRRTEMVIGSSRYYRHDPVADDISIGFTFLTCDYWGGQTNYELKKLMLDYAFNFFDAVWFHISPANIRSQNATLKIGAALSHEEILPISGKDELWYCYRIDKGDWLKAFQTAD